MNGMIHSYLRSAPIHRPYQQHQQHRRFTRVSGSPIVACLKHAEAKRRNRIHDNSVLLPVATAEPILTLDNKNLIPTSTEEQLVPNRAPQLVLTIATRVRIAAWMKQTELNEGSTKIASKAVRKFPQYFRGSANANIKRTGRLWKQRDEFTGKDGGVSFRGTTTSITKNTNMGMKRVYLKAKAGRGKKRQQWVDAFHQDLRSEFDRLRKLGVKFNLNTIRSLAFDMLSSSTKTEYSNNMLDPPSQRPLFEKITPRFEQAFADRFRIVSRAHKGKFRLSLEKELQIEQDVARHLGIMKRMLTDGTVDENDIGNADETHFVINVDNGRTLGFSGEDDVKYSDVVLGGEGMTMIVRLSGGRDSRIEPPFMIFTNKDRNYPVRGTPDDVPGVSYRTGPKGWMDTTIMPRWLNEQKVISPLPNNRRRILFVDYCSGHNDTDLLREAAEKISTDTHYFPPNCTHLIQPCDSFIIQKIKRAWTTRSGNFKMNMIRQNKWKDKSGKLLNPGKHFFLRLAADSVRDVSRQRDVEGISFARKAMIITGMALNTNGQWQVSQLRPKLQEL